MWNLEISSEDFLQHLKTTSLTGKPCLGIVTTIEQSYGPEFTSAVKEALEVALLRLFPNEENLRVVAEVSGTPARLHWKVIVIIPKPHPLV
jgi:hypothetical protein